MKTAIVQVIQVYFYISNAPCSCSLHSTFNYFDILKSSDVSYRVSRSARNGSEKTIHLAFTSFRQRFTMLLKSGAQVLHPEAKATLVDGPGQTTEMEIDRSLFFSGSVEGFPDYEVDAASFGDIWIAHIHTPQEFYAVEPLVFYDRRADQRLMIAYRGRDIKIENQTYNKPFCKEFSFEKRQRSFEYRKRGRNANYYPKRNTFKSQARAPYNTITSAQAISGHKPALTKLFSLVDSPRKSNRNSYVFRKKQRRAAKTTERRGEGAGENLGSTDPRDVGETNSAHRRVGRGSVDPDLGCSLRCKRDGGQWPSRNKYCNIFSIVDHTLFNGIGNRNEMKIINTLVLVYTEVNRIFHRTVFGDLEPGYGILVRGFLLHRQPSIYGYNTDERATASQLLVEMTNHEEFLNYCLVHLSVERFFKVELGVATVAKPNGLKEGICGTCHRHFMNFSFNVALTTVKSGACHVMSMKQYSLVVAHEVGHSWGSRHDPSKDRECSPSSENGGKFLMWAHSMDGRRDNEDRFSPCSVREIAKVLKSRVPRCFLNEANVREECGNGLLERSEQCDPGYGRLAEGDACCTRQCRLRPSAKCSPRHQPCCTEDCNIANSTHKCFPKEGLLECYSQAYCLGINSWECPLAKPLPNRTPCGDKGWCWHGRCVSFCEKLGLAMDPPRQFRPCQCEQNKRAMCRHCCRQMDVLDRASYRKCKVMGGWLRDGSHCLTGICSDGVCKQQLQSDKDTDLGKYFLSDVDSSCNAKAAVASSLLRAAMACVTASLHFSLRTGRLW